jgi:hypothetical protein
MGLIRRLWNQIIEDLGHDHPVLATVRVSVVTVSLTCSRPGEADSWIKTAVASIHEKFASDNAGFRHFQAVNTLWQVKPICLPLVLNSAPELAALPLTSGALRLK